ncbi:MAG: DNA mismatch repair protein MutS [Armatimonadetes bacterium]|nr:DNA mismatch repair protein MutS [Armatimonadota bacterium]
MTQDKLTPMFRQWQAAKARYPDALLLFRMGDFYEMFGEDAETGARELELTLTSRECGKGRRIPMCGVPHHAVQRYLQLLIRKGFRAALCDQVEDPKLAKGLVRRDVTRVVTPGTLLEDEFLDRKTSNYLTSVALDGGAWGLASVDVSTGEFIVTEMRAPSPAVAPRELLEPAALPHGPPTSVLEELARIEPAEIVAPPALIDALRGPGSHRVLTPLEEPADAFRTPAERLARHFGVSSLEGFGIADMTAGLRAAAAALDYLAANHLDSLPHLRAIRRYSLSDTMMLDEATKRNLELTRTLRGDERGGSLLSLLDRTLTPMGGRLIRRWLLHPLLDVGAVRRRLDAVENLLRDPALAGGLRDGLRGVYDLERLISRAAAGTANARDLRALSTSIARLPAIAHALGAAQADLLRDLAARQADLDPVRGLIDAAIVQDPPAITTEGGLINPGFSAELDEIREAATSGKQWIAALQEQERQATGIKSLKVGFNQVFGYYIEITRPNLHLAPDRYIRKQTMVGAERFITPELKEKESQILGAEERMAALEYDLFTEVRARVAEHAEAVLATAQALAELDVLLAYSQIALEHGYVKPEVHEGTELEIVGGRHPVVEAALDGEPFVPNDARLDCEHNQLLIITGPNMAGKSTYLRQVALTVLLAQIGSFVPAQRASIGLCDRIFTRVGAMDDLATGQSTFMVEMTETALILNNATGRSLIVLDEIGRGTSTFDGLSIAWAVSEHLVNQVGAKTLFATHYHHLNELAEILPRVRNYRITVKEEADDIVFLRRIVPGGTDRSYGVQVARLAGLPAGVIERAKEVLAQLETEDLGAKAAPSRAAAARVSPPIQLQLFEAAEHPLARALKSVSVDELTPLEALVKLKELREQAERDR